SRRRPGPIARAFCLGYASTQFQYVFRPLLRPATMRESFTMRHALLAIAWLAATALPVFANDCEDDVKKIEAALASQELSSDQRAQVEDMKKQAAQLCAAGNTQESRDVSAEAKAMLNIE